MDQKPLKPWRRTYINEKKFQYALIGYSILMAGAVIFSLFIGINTFFTRSSEQAQALGLMSDHVFFDFINRQEKAVKLLFTANAVIIFGFMSLFALFLSHRVAGPLSRVKLTLQKMAQGEDPGKVSFRRNDYFQELADLLNKVNELLRAKR